MQIQASSQVIPLPGVPTLFLDVKTPEDITDSKVPRPPQVFRGFQLFQITLKGGDPPSAQVAFPRLQGKTECSWISRQEQVLPPKLEEAPQKLWGCLPTWTFITRRILVGGQGIEVGTPVVNKASLASLPALRE